MKLPENLFELTEEQISTSKMMYSDKIIKCLVAPYHTYKQLEERIPYTNSTYLFPERDMSAQQVRSLVSMIVASPINDEIRIITADQTIIGDMVNTSVRILTEYDTIVETEGNTFAANIHDIRYNVLQNPIHQKSKIEKEQSKEEINKLIERIRGGKMTHDEVNAAREFINMIGEPVIRGPLESMLNEMESKLPPKLSKDLQEKLDSGKMYMNDVKRVISFCNRIDDADTLEDILKKLKSVKYLD